MKMFTILEAIQTDGILNILFRAIRSILSRFIAWLLWVSGSFHSKSMRPIAFGRGFRFINSKSFFFNEGVSFGINARIESHNKGSIYFGKNTSFGDYLHIGSSNSVRIGNDVLGGSNILIIDHSHGNSSDLFSEEQPPRLREIKSAGQIIIGNNVWLCDGVFILPNVTIGDGSVIGPGVIVRKNVEPYSLVLR